MGMPITNKVQSPSKAFANLDALGLAIRSVMRPPTPIGRARASGFFNKDLIACDSSKQLSSCFGLIMADLSMQGEMVHDRVA
jgi:hypothetical protein